MSCMCCADADMVPLADFVPFVSPSLTEAPDLLIQQFIRQTAISLCREVALLKDVITIDLQACVHDYPIVVDNACLIPREVGEVRVFCPRAGRWQPPLSRLKSRPLAGQCNPAGYWLKLPHEIYVVPHPQEDIPGGLAVELILQPGQDADSLPRSLYEEHAELLAEGALSRLLLLKTASWHDPSAAGIALKRYKGGVSTIRAEEQRGDTSVPLMAKAPRWA